MRHVQHVCIQLKQMHSKANQSRKQTSKQNIDHFFNTGTVKKISNDSVSMKLTQLRDNFFYKFFIKGIKESSIHTLCVYKHR